METRRLTIEDRIPEVGDVIIRPSEFGGVIGEGLRRRVIAVEGRRIRLCDGWLSLESRRAQQTIYARRADSGSITSAVAPSDMTADRGGGV